MKYKNIKEMRMTVGLTNTITSNIETKVVRDFIPVSSLMEKMLLAIEKSEITITELSNKMGIEKGTISRYAATLNLMGMVGFEINGRKKCVKLTDNGKKLYNQLKSKNRLKSKENKRAVILLL